MRFLDLQPEILKRVRKTIVTDPETGLTGYVSCWQKLNQGLETFGNLRMSAVVAPYKLSEGFFRQ